jgi:hypothetical protein
VQGGGAGNDDEQPDDAGQDGADDDVDAFVPEVVDVQALVDGVHPQHRRRPGGHGRAGARCPARRLRRSKVTLFYDI